MTSRPSNADCLVGDFTLYIAIGYIIIMQLYICVCTFNDVCLLTGNDTSDGVKLDIEFPPSSEESKDKTEDDDAADIEVEESNTGRSLLPEFNHLQTDIYQVKVM